MGATGNLYCGLDEFNDMGFLLHFLRKEDLFVDVGANIGSYTVLASAECGSKSISVEPNFESFQMLMENIRLNNIDSKVTPLNMGLGSQPGILSFTQNKGTVNHVAVEGETNTIETRIDSLDSILNDHNPQLLKVDVEGFEHEVFRGATDTLSKSSLKAIIVELVNHGHRYGFDDKEVHTQLLKEGFEPYAYDPFTRSFDRKKGFDTQNTLYLRDLPILVFQ